MAELRRSLLYASVSALAILAAAPALAQTADSADTLETVIVSGTRTGTNIADVAPVGTESISIDREKILATGMTNLGDVVKTMPQVQGLNSSNRETSNYSFNPTQVSTINLRGLGASATLTLVDGRRVVPTGSTNTFTEAGQLPLAMVERIEMLVDGASAIYGSDAIGGVVNYVTRKDYDGLQFSPRYTYDHSYSAWGVALTAGQTWESLGALGKGSLMIGYDYDQRTPFRAGTQPLLRQDLRRFGGGDNRVLGSNLIPLPGNSILVNSIGGIYSYYTVASGISGTTVPTAAQFTQHTSADDLPVADSSDYTDFIGRRWRHQAIVSLNQQILPWLDVYYQGFFTKRQTTMMNTVSPVGYYSYNTDFKRDMLYGTMPIRANVSTTPWAIPGLYPSTITPTRSLQQYVVRGFGPFDMVFPEDTFNQSFGFNAKLPFDWNGTGYFTWGLDTVCGACIPNGFVDYGAYELGLRDATSAATSVNPFVTGTLPQMSSLTGSQYNYARNMIDDFGLKFDGPLFDLPGGTVKAAIGGEFSYATEHFKAGQNQSPGYPTGLQQPRTSRNQFLWDVNTGKNRTIGSFFTEIYVPLIGEQMHVPFVKNFFVDAAVRYDEYSDVGGTTNPKVGLTWEVNDELQARGSWGTSFRAPTLTDLNPYVASVHSVLPGSYGLVRNYSGDSFYGAPGAAMDTLLVSGNSPILQPETAENWSAGLDYKPNWLRGFHISTTYWNVVYANQIYNMQNYVINAFADPSYYTLYGNYIHKVSDVPSNCVGTDPTTWGPTLNHWIYDIPAVSGSINSGYICSVKAVLDGRYANVATNKTRGIDINIDYLYPTDSYGLYTFNLYLATVLDNKVQGTPGGGFIEQINGLQQPIRWRGRGSIGWIMDPMTATVFVNYTGAGVNAAPLTAKNWVPDFFTVDLNLNYKFSDDMGWKGFDGTTLSLSVQNVFDQNPPIELQNNSQHLAFDYSRYSIMGRVITVQLTKDL